MSLEGVDQPRDPQARNEVFMSVVTGYLESGKLHQLKMMVIGEAGQGKSTLINGLLGKEVAKEGDSFVPGTLKIQQYHLNQNGVKIGIWDTPGFGVESPEEDEKVVEQLRSSDCHPIDLALFCIRMDAMRIPTRVHIDTMKKLTEVFGRKFWRYCLFVLTFANNVEQFCPQGEEMVYYFSQRCIEIEDQLREALKKHVGLEGKELERVRAVPVGSYKKGLYRSNPWALPDREDWFVMFWLECTDHMCKSAVSALLQANYHRLEAVAGDASIISLSPPPQFEAHERLIESNVAEISDIEQQLRKSTIIVEQESAKEEATGTRQVLTKRRNPSNTPQPPPGIDEFPRSEQVNTSQVDPPVAVADESSPHDQDPELGTHQKKVPLYETLLNELEDKDSGFFEYVSRFAKKRGEQVWILGHLGGFIEGLAYYLGRARGTRKIKKQ